MLNLSTLLQESARRYPDKTAIIFNESKATYAQLNALANQIANALVHIGIKPGDKVAISCPNLPYFPMIYYGILKAGAVVVPLSVLLKKDEIAYHLNDSDAKAYFCFTGNEALPMFQMGYAAFKETPLCEHFILLPGPADVISIPNDQDIIIFNSFIENCSSLFDPFQTSAEDTALIIYTSGTTGHPKGAELTHNNLVHNALLCVEILTLTKEDNVLIVLPLFHIFGMTVLMNAGIFKGSQLVLLSRFETEATYHLLQKHQITVFAGVPSMYWSLLQYHDPKFDYDTIARDLRICVSGGASLPVKVMEDFEKRFNVKIYEGYGMSEGSPVVCFNMYEFGRKAGSVGKPVWGVDVRLVDENDQDVPTGEKGELLYRGHNVMKGYYKKPEATTEALRNGWMHSGDIAIRDEDGFYFIVDRTKDMINRGGFKVFPREVEEVMLHHPAVSTVAVVGFPSERLGEEVMACVVLKENMSADEQELIQWTQARIAEYKYPRKIKFMKALPMSATGKVLKKNIPRD
jgi:long-chain acyl-CoA synthetase